MTYVDVDHHSSDTGVSSLPQRTIGTLSAALQRLQRKRLALVAAGGLAVAVAAWAFWGSWDTGYTAQQDLVLHPVSKGSLPITVVERGNLESQLNVEILCEVDDVRNDGINGTPIVWIVPNGASVKKGDLLVELDSTALQEELDQQTLDYERARAEQVQFQVQLANQETQNETVLSNAELEVTLAELELEMFTDAEKGTHKLEVEEIQRAIDDLNNEILAAQANLELKRNEANGIESLFKLGYAGKSELDRSRLEFLQAESQYVAKMNRMETELATLKKKETFERQMQLLTLQGKLDTADRNRVQVERDNQAKMAQAEASNAAAAESLKKEEERLKRYQSQLEKCKIYAPQDGMVAYASSRDEEVREGAPVRSRQRILSLPNLNRMHVETAIHESVLDQIEPGLKANVTVDAFPGRTYGGIVQSVAVLPDQSNWFSSETKVYKTVVVIEEDVQQLKPGMTAVVEILVDRLDNVLTVPIQAVVQVENKNWCYVDKGGTLLRRSIEVGRTNDQFVQIRQGLAQGDQVVLNPMAISSSMEDLPDEPIEPGGVEDAEPEVTAEAASDSVS